jgi:hypothetical protein
MAALSSQDQFQKVLSVAATQFKKQKISVRFGPVGKMRFVIDEASLREALAGSGLEEGTFRGVFDNEVGPLLEAVVSGELDQYIDRAHFLLGEDSPDEKTRAARKPILTGRARLVESSLVDPELRGRFLIKTTSKHPRLRKPAWEVAAKTALSDKEAHVQPYATLSFETIRPELALRSFAWFPFFPTEATGKSEFCTFDCDESDLDDMLQFITEAKAALRKASSGEASAWTTKQ